ncbi:hypothetical protein SE955_06460 [Escherichia coli]|nr:hypothetical protein [Escherichia coli]
MLWQKFEQDENRIVIPLSGEWAKDESGKFKPSRSYKLHIEWGDWSKAKKTMLLNELETVQEEAKEAVNKKLKRELKSSLSVNKALRIRKSST